MSDPELAAVKGGADRLVKREEGSWQDGGWAIALYGLDPDDPLGAIPPLDLVDADEGEAA